MIPNNPLATGLMPDRRIDGAKWGNSLRPYLVPASVANAIYYGDPVLKTAGLAGPDGTPSCDLAAAGAADKITGVCCGFLGTNPAGTGMATSASLFGFSGTPGNVYRPAASALDWYILVNDDPEAEFVVMSSDNVAIPTAAIVGKNVNLVAGAGSPYTGWGGWKFDPNSAAVGATLQFRITGVLPEIDNTVGLANCRFIGQINTPTELPNSAGI